MSDIQQPTISRPTESDNGGWLRRFVRGHNHVTLYNADCRDVLSEIVADYIITDPPYGIAYDAGRYSGATFDGVMAGDESEYDPSPILELNLKSGLWGANNYSSKLPRGGWICWDKRCCEEADRALGSPFELAWCSETQIYKIIRMQHGGWINKDAPNERRLHPTQKPAALMGRCMTEIKVPEGATVLDPYMGSGTTGIACLRTNRNFIGIEKDAKHFATACARLERECNQGALL